MWFCSFSCCVQMSEQRNVSCSPNTLWAGNGFLEVWFIVDAVIVDQEWAHHLPLCRVDATSTMQALFPLKSHQKSKQIKTEAKSVFNSFSMFLSFFINFGPKSCEIIWWDSHWLRDLGPVAVVSEVSGRLKMLTTLMSIKIRCKVNYRILERTQLNRWSNLELSSYLRWKLWWLFKEITKDQSIIRWFDDS